MLIYTYNNIYIYSVDTEFQEKDEIQSSIYQTKHLKTHMLHIPIINFEVI